MEFDIVKYQLSLKIICCFIFSLAMMRLVQVEIIALISDLLCTITIAYFYLKSFKCTAVLLLINAVVAVFFDVKRLNSYNQTNANGKISAYISIYGILLYTILALISLIGILFDDDSDKNKNEDEIIYAPIRPNKNENYGTLEHRKAAI